MKHAYTIVCRGSWLSLAQAEIFKKKVAEKFPEIIIDVVIKETAGDINQTTPLHLVDGKDFFTKEIQDHLYSGEADFAVHSMKDVSSEEFFKNSNTAIIDREDIRDVVIFNKDVINKIEQGDKIIIGTSSPRRTDMALAFLEKALPKLSERPLQLLAEPIRGNVDTRLQKLHNKQYDGIILAVAGLNRLLNYAPSKKKVEELLADKKLMVLPLFECPPAAGQGAIVAETTNENADAIKLLDAIKNDSLTKAITKERKYAYQYGYGCSQLFGTFHLDLPLTSFTYASGKRSDGSTFSEWDITIEKIPGRLFSSTDHMKDFFSIEPLEEITIDENVNVYFVASHKAVNNNAIEKIIKQKRVWAAGTRTWYELAKKGIWVEGCADGLGLEFLSSAFFTKLIGIEKTGIQIITNTSSAIHWKTDGWNSVGTYVLTPQLPQSILNEISLSDSIFWTSFQQYEQCKKYLKEGVQHLCPAGKTATLLIAAGIKPIVFPTIKAFNEWRATNIIATNAG